MSQAFMEGQFPLASHLEAEAIRQAVGDSLYSENANSMVGEWSEDAELYVRSDWSRISRWIEGNGIELTPQQERDLIDFASDYASLVDEEEDIAELRAIRNEGEK